MGGQYSEGICRGTQTTHGHHGFWMIDWLIDWLIDWNWTVAAFAGDSNKRITYCVAWWRVVMGGRVIACSIRDFMDTPWNSNHTSTRGSLQFIYFHTVALGPLSLAVVLSIAKAGQKSNWLNYRTVVLQWNRQHEPSGYRKQTVIDCWVFDWPTGDEGLARYRWCDAAGVSVLGSCSGGRNLLGSNHSRRFLFIA